MKKFKIQDLVIIAMLAGLGIVTKIIINSPIKAFSSSIGIPGGAIVGGFYMLWIPIGLGITKKFGTATLLAFVQSLIVLIVGTSGSHGILSLITYTTPGIICDLVFLTARKNGYNALHYLIGVGLANVTGTLFSNILFFNLPFVPLLITLLGAMTSGAFGGLIAYGVINSINKTGILDEINKKDYDELNSIYEQDIKENQNKTNEDSYE